MVDDFGPVCSGIGNKLCPVSAVVNHRIGVVTVEGSRSVLCKGGQME